MRNAGYALITLLLTVPALAVAQDAGQPTNDAPNNYTTHADYFKLPEGRTWGSTSALGIDKDGQSISVADRCGHNRRLDSAPGKMSGLPTVLAFRSARTPRKDPRARPARTLAAGGGPCGGGADPLSPGYRKTDMRPVDEPRFRRHWVEDAPLVRYGTVSELAPAVVFLASDASSFVTGSVLVAYVGYTAL